MKKLLFGLAFSLALLGGIFFYQNSKFSDTLFHVVFCDVGQGDAIHIRTPKGFDVLVDAGPSQSVLSCLEQSMPFWDRTIDVALLTHPHEDHLAGFIPVLERYTVLSFVTENLSNDSESFRKLMDIIKHKRIPLRHVLQEDSFNTNDGVSFRIVGPSKQFLERTSPGGKIGEKSEFASVITLVSYGLFDVLLTGDSQKEGLEDAISLIPGSIDVLQVPHHGSKTGLSKELIDQLNPSLAVVSVGKNRYGHPKKETLDLLSFRNIKVLRTDQDGEVEIISDGESFTVR